MGKVREYAPHRSWTKEEEEKLIFLSGRDTKSGIAKKLGRSVSSVNCKRIQMGLPSFTDGTDRLTITQIAELTGLDKSSISKTWRKYGIEFKKAGYYMVITEEKLFEFMRANPQLWRASKCDYYFFSEYDWFMEKLEQERRGEDAPNHYQNHRSWTAIEISRLKMLKQRGFTHKQIADELGRTKRSVDHMSMRLSYL